MSTIPSDGPNPIRPIETELPLSVRAREAIRSAIIVGQLAPGTLHSVQALATRFGISRTPVREALIDLSKQGMVRFERNRGVRILETSVQDLEEILAIRLLLEPPATYLAVAQFTSAALRELEIEVAEMESATRRSDQFSFMRHDRAFHSIVLGMSGNRRLQEFIDQIRDLVVARGNSTLGTTRSPRELVEEHRLILHRIREGDALGAASAMREHISRTGSLLIAQEGGDGAVLERAWGDLPRFDPHIVAGLDS